MFCKMLWGSYSSLHTTPPPPPHTHTHPHTHVGNNLHTLNTTRKVCELDFNQGHMPSTQHKDGDLNGWRRCLPNTAIYRGRGRAPRRLWLRLLSEHAIHQLYVIRSCPYTRITCQSTTHERLYLRLKSFSRHSLATPYTHTHTHPNSHVLPPRGTAIDECNMPALQIAANRGDAAAVRQLLLKNPDSDIAIALTADASDDAARRHVSPGKWTALMAAAAKGRSAAVVAEILEHGNRQLVDAVEGNGATALFLAVEKGHTAIVELLLTKGNADASMRTNFGVAPLFIAAQNNFVDIVRLLVDNGQADVAKATTIVPPPSSSVPNSPSTPLYVAAQNGHADVVELLLFQLESDVDTPKRHSGATPLFIAAQMNRTKVAALLLRHNADTSLATVGDIAPLYIAAENGHAAMVELLLGAGCSVDAASSEGATPLFVAAMHGHTEVVALLLRKGKANVALAMTANGVGPLYIAAEFGHTDIVALLLREGKADANQATAEGGVVPLFMAAQNGHSAIAELLILSNATVDPMRGGGGITPLFAAVLMNRVATVEVLLRHGADAERRLQGKHKVTPLALAEMNGFADVARLLRAGTG